MAYLVRLTDRTLLDLEDIYRTIEAENSTVAHQWFHGFAAAIQSLEMQPLRESRGQREQNAPPVACTVQGAAPTRIIYHADVRKDTIDQRGSMCPRHGARKEGDPNQKWI